MGFVAARPAPGSPPPVPPGGDQPAPFIGLTYFNADQVNAEGAKLVPPPKQVTMPRWQLTTAFGYVSASGEYFKVPAHRGNVAEPYHSTDLATVPSFLWAILAPYGRQMRPALLHDHRCDIALREPDNSQALAIRKSADDLFREALGVEGVGPVRRVVFWAGVSFGRFLHYQRIAGWALALIVLLGAFVALHAAALALGAPPGVDAWFSSRWFWIVIAGLAAVAALFRSWLYLALLPVGAFFIVACFVGTASFGPSVLRSWTAHALVGGALVGLTLLLGAVTDWRVGLVGQLVAPLIVPVIVVTTFVESVLALPDVVIWIANGAHGIRPTPAPTTLRWRL